MELKREIPRFSKERVYELYISLVYERKEYDNISRNKMVNEILKEYELDNYLYYLCTKKELDFLKKYNEKEITEEIKDKYRWEIDSLIEKCIISRSDNKVFDEQIENVDKALEYYKVNSGKYDDEIVMMMIGIIRINGQLLTKSLKSIITSLYKVTDEQIDSLFGHPLFHFYCGFDVMYLEMKKDYEELIYYRKYWNLLDDIIELRKEFGIAGCLSINSYDFFDFFYYGFNISNPKVKKMYDIIKKHPTRSFLLEIIEESRLLNQRNILRILNLDEKTLKLIEEALDEMPCAIMNGFTPNQYQKEITKQKEIDKDFIREEQENAHLTKQEADLYYKLYFALLEYVNDKYKIEKKIKKIYKQDGLDPKFLYPIDKYIWEHKEVIDEFIKDNKYNFSENELEDIKLFKNSVSDLLFIVVGFEKEYTKILSKEGKLYMVKGIRTNLDEIIGYRELPITINTTLLMFKNKIIYNSFLSPFDIQVGNDFKEQILKDASTAIKHYHL